MSIRPTYSDLATALFTLLKHVRASNDVIISDGYEQFEATRLRNLVDSIAAKDAAVRAARKLMEQFQGLPRCERVGCNELATHCVGSCEVSVDECDSEQPVLTWYCLEHAQEELERLREDHEYSTKCPSCGCVFPVN